MKLLKIIKLPNILTNVKFHKTACTQADHLFTKNIYIFYIKNSTFFNPNVFIYTRVDLDSKKENIWREY